MKKEDKLFLCKLAMGFTLALAYKDFENLKKILMEVEFLNGSSN